MSPSPIGAAKPAAAAVPDAPPTAGATAQIDKNAFLKLLVAQLQNQNPLNPADGTTFITQLAGFSQLEQTISMREDIAAIRASLEGQSPAAAAQPTNSN